MIAMVNLREFNNDEERRPEQPDSSKTVKYVAMTEKVFEKFSKTEEEHPLLKELPEIPGERAENIQLQILTTINMDDAFIFIRDHIKSMGIDPVVAVEPYANALMGFRVAAVRTINDVDWITAMFYTPDKMATLLSHADVPVADNGQILIVRPKKSSTSILTRK